MVWCRLGGGGSDGGSFDGANVIGAIHDVIHVERQVESVCERLTINNITSTFTLFGMDTYTHASIGLEASRSHPASHCITLHHTDDCRWTEVVKDCTKIIYDDGSTHLYPSSLLQAILDPSRLWLGVLTCARASVPTHPSHPFRADAPFQCSS